MNRKNQIMVDSLREENVLKSEVIARALLSVNRADFVPDSLLDFAYKDTALPIGFGQTISQPYTVVFMLELLDLQPGNLVFEVGFGSGWQTAILANIVGSEGKVYAYELIPELFNFGNGNINKYGELKDNVVLYCGNAKNGVEQFGPQSLDRIIASAEVKEVPEAWRSQLKIGGIMVYPAGQSIYREVKQSESKFSVERYSGFAFVPFID